MFLPSLMSFYAKRVVDVVEVAYWKVQLVPCLDETSILDYISNNFLADLDFPCNLSSFETDCA